MNLKIAVVYNTEPKLCDEVQQRPDIYFPLIGGKANNNKDLVVDLPNVHYDNEGRNISWMNPYINETTCVYWLGRNLDKIGNPDYVGLHHYRRLFALQYVMPYIQPGVLILNKEKVMLPTVDFLELCHDIGRYFSTTGLKVFRSDIPEIKRMFTEYAFSQVYYSRNLFIVPANVAVILSDFIEAVLKHVAIDINYDMLGTPAARNIGFIMERFIGFFFLLLEKQYHYKVHPTMFYYVNMEDE